MIECASWTGTAAALLLELNKQDTEAKTEAKPSKWKTWPAEPSSFSRRLRKAASVLRKMGIIVEIGRAPDRSRTRMIELSKVETKPSEPSEASRAKFGQFGQFGRFGFNQYHSNASEQ